ncbi:unnamed protein product [Urochloa decumbens]|uniref:Uncharacterized protein n=1 Tax=Urochloa decumbens TaxID=240449 RepID=A0ABC9B379_9POAL
MKNRKVAKVVDDPSLEDSANGKLHEVLPRLSKSVVSLYTFDGNDKCAEFTGIVSKSNACDTCILTSASGIRCFQGPTRINMNLSIFVNLPNGKTAMACLTKIDFDRNILTVTIGPFPDFREASLDHKLEVGPNNNVAALCCNKTRVGFSSGIVTELSEEFDGQKLTLSTCQIPELGTGGPLVDFEGNFVGMNMCHLKEGTLFLPKKKVLESFLPFRIRFRIRQASREICKSSTTHIPEDIEKLTSSPDFCPLPDNELTKELTKDLSSRGYPLPVTIEGGMHLRNGFEEKFPGDTWNKLTEKVASSLSLSVVSLASFLDGGAREKTRFFACTGVIIGSFKSMTRILTSASLVTVNKKIDENLKIQVLLPTNKHTEGKLQDYDLRYNIAVVTITDFHCRRIANLHAKRDDESYPKVVAIGRIFETGELMATSGVLTDNSSKLVSEETGASTCKVTKAGIGGPLIAHNGNFIGMNFYGAKETPYVPRNIILKLLKEFDRKGCVAADDRADNINQDRWSVPRPYWYYPSLAPRRIWGRRRYA